MDTASVIRGNTPCGSMARPLWATASIIDQLSSYTTPTVTVSPAASGAGSAIRARFAGSPVRLTSAPSTVTRSTRQLPGVDCTRGTVSSRASRGFSDRNSRVASIWSATWLPPASGCANTFASARTDSRPWNVRVSGSPRGGSTHRPSATVRATVCSPIVCPIAITSAAGHPWTSLR
ncbi:MAG: hypothetical protein KC621_13445 [Myxococcales bacterium]|nr:hypothetical protein [Myxococcales bacterium]